MKKIKNIWIWIIIWAWLTLSLWAYAATNGTLWELFKLMPSGEYKLMWDNIEYNTVDSSEIENNSLTSADLAADSVWSSELANNSVWSLNIINNTITETDISDSFKARDSNKVDNIDSTQFIRSDQNDTMNWVLTVQNWLNRVISTDSWRWIQSYWTDAWGSFYDVDSGSYSILWIAEYALFWKWEINLIWDINLTWDVSTWWEKLATEEYVDNNLWWDTWLTCEYINDEVNNWNITKYCSSWYTLVSCDGYKVTFDDNGTYYESTYNKTLYSDHCRASGSSSWWTAIKMTCCK